MARVPVRPVRQRRLGRRRRLHGVVHAAPIGDLPLRAGARPRRSRGPAPVRELHRGQARGGAGGGRRAGDDRGRRNGRAVHAPLQHARLLVQQALLSWSARTRRDLPWRRTRDPWAILVSELMLQQTQVPRVIPKYDAFLRRFPTPAACAAAPVGAVVRQWAGLGDNRRAVHQHTTAVAVVERHGGSLPDDLDALLALPGVGPYTARAVLAFAFGRDVGLVESNTARVLARTSGRPLTGREAQALADDLVPAGHGWAWN